MQTLPQEFVERGLALAAGATLFGKPFADMTRDELIAAAANGWAAERKARAEFAGTAEARAALFAEQARLNGHRAA